MCPCEPPRPASLRARGCVLPLLAVPVILAGCGRLSLTGVHGTPAQTEDEPATVAVTHFGDKLELFMEHPYLVQGQGAKFNVHLTVREDGMPIRSGTLTVVATGPTGKAVTVEQEAPRSPGIYGPTIAFPEAGRNELALTLRSEQAEETIRVPVTVYPDEAAAQKAAEAADEPEPEGAITFLKEQQWKIGLTLQPVGTRRLVERLTVPGEVTPAAGARAVVTPPMAGRVLPPSGGAFPRVGEEVQAGQEVAVIEPPLAGPQGVQLLANRAQVQSLETELMVRQMGVEVEISKAKIDLDHARYVFQRVQTLSSRDAIAKKQLDEAEHQLQIAQVEYEGKQKLREPYEQARKQLRAMLDPTVPGPDATSPASPVSPSPSPSMRMSLRAPISGTVTAAQATQGEFIEPTKELFTVINLDRVWVEARVSEYDLGRVVKAPAADLALAAYPGRRFPVLGSDGGKLIDVGSVVDPGNRTIPVRYEVPNPDRLLKVGLFADVAIETARAEEVPAVPEAALVDEDGRPTVYVQLDGEHFQKRDIEPGLRDAGFVQVKQGLKPGEQVVVKGAYAIRLASVSSVIPAHGHAH
jgi:membrane fusion protein, heavy metal efflux system